MSVVPTPDIYMVLTAEGSPEHFSLWPDDAHQHINEAVGEHDIDGAAGWVVRRYVTADLAEAAKLREFYTGVCVALTAITADDSPVVWVEIVRSCGDELLYHAAHVEPDEWELAGFAKYAWSELRKRKPRKRAGS